MVSHFRGRASGAAVEKWCTRYGQQKQSQFSIHKYGNDEASVLCQAWCHKLSYYFAAHRESAKPDYVFDEDDHGAYIEPARFSQLIGMSTDEDLHSRACEIRELKPSHVLFSGHDRRLIGSQAGLGDPTRVL